MKKFQPYPWNYGEGKISRKKIREVIEAMMAEEKAAQSKTPLKRSKQKVLVAG